MENDEGPLTGGPSSFLVTCSVVGDGAVGRVQRQAGVVPGL
jgi:hypothetical protein